MISAKCFSTPLNVQVAHAPVPTPVPSPVTQPWFHHEDLTGSVQIHGVTYNSSLGVSNEWDGLGLLGPNLNLHKVGIKNTIMSA